MTNRLPILAPVTAVALFLGLATSYGENPDQSSSLDETTLIYDSTGYEIHGKGDATWRIEQRTLVVDEEGSEEATISLFEDQFVSIRKFTGWLYDADGTKLHKWGKNDLNKQCGFGESYMLYSDACYYFKKIDPDNYPVTVAYEVEYKVSAELSAFMPTFKAQYDIPLQRGTFTLKAPREFQFEVHERGELSAPESKLDEKSQWWKWTVEGAAAFESEPFMPSPSLYKSAIEFAPRNFRMGDFRFDASDWGTLATGYSMMISSQYHLSNAQLDMITTARQQDRTTPEFVADLHDSLSSRSRYVAVHIGLSGWMPRSASETFDKRYGDCKDLSTMYTAMMTKSEITTRPVLILTKDEGIVATELPGFKFNHVILLYLHDNDTIWIDPTCFGCSQGDLPWQDENSLALVVDSSDGGLVWTRASTASQNTVVRHADIFPTSASSGKFAMEIKCAGNSAHPFHLAESRLDGEEIFSALRYFGIIEDRLSRSASGAVSISSGRSRFGCAFSGVDRQMSLSLPDRIYVDFSLLPIFHPAELVDLEERLYPINLRFPRSFHDTCMIHLPGGYSAPSLPESRSWSGEFGGGRIDFVSNDSIIVMRRSRYVDRYQIEPQEFAPFSEFLDSCRAILDPRLVLYRSDIATTQGDTAE